MKLKPNLIKKPRVEILPLIDVVFLLLVVFIYSMFSMTMHKGLAIKLPVSSTVSPEKALIISISITKDNFIYLEKQQIDLNELVSTLKKRIKNAPKNNNENIGVLLFAHKNIAFQNLFKVLDKIKTAGISKISLQAKSDQ